MARDKRSRSKVNHIEGQVRSLVKENRQLKHQLARADKAVINMHHTIDTAIEVTRSKPEMPKCPDCKCNISVIDFGVKIVSSCKSCGYRSVQKKEG